MDIIITAATVLATVSNSIGTTDSDYYYNANVENNQVNRLEVLHKCGNYLSRKVQYNFIYDDENRLLVKEAQRWNADRLRWEPSYKLEYAYNENGFSVARSDWDRKADAYGKVNEMMDYTVLNDNVMAISILKRTNETLELDSRMLAMNSSDAMLLAMADKELAH